jgi:hypothetical protein
MSLQNLASRLQFETLRSLAFGSISGAYMGVGTSITHPARAIMVNNTTDVLLIFSMDGVNNHFVVPATTSIVLDIQANKSLMSGFYLGQGDRLYVKDNGDAATLGAVYFSVMYGRE